MKIIIKVLVINFIYISLSSANYLNDINENSITTCLIISSDKLSHTYEQSLVSTDSRKINTHLTDLLCLTDAQLNKYTEDWEYKGLLRLNKGISDDSMRVIYSLISKIYRETYLDRRVFSVNNAFEDLILDLQMLRGLINFEMGLASKYIGDPEYLASIVNLISAKLEFIFKLKEEGFSKYKNKLFSKKIVLSELPKGGMDKYSYHLISYTIKRSIDLIKDIQSIYNR